MISLLGACRYASLGSRLRSAPALLLLVTLAAGCTKASTPSTEGPADAGGASDTPDVPTGTVDPGKTSGPVPSGEDAGPVVTEPVVREGDVIVRSLADLRDLAGVNVLRGVLRVERADVLDLEPLAQLHEVRSLVVRDNEALRSLHGLEALARIEGDLVVEESPALTSLDGLATLAHVGGAVRIGNDQKAVVDPKTRVLQGLVPATENGALTTAVLPALARAGSVVVLRNSALERLAFPSLTQVDGALEVSFAPKLAALAESFPLLEAVGGVLTIGRMPEQVSVMEGGTSKLLSVPAHDNEAMTTMRWPRLRLARNVNVRAMGDVGSFSAPALEAVDEELSLLCATSRLDALVTVGGNLTLTNTRELSMPRLSRVRHDLVVWNVKLRSLDMLERLSRIDGGIIVRYGELESLRLPQFLTADSITIDKINSLQSIVLPTLERVATTLQISGNPALTRLELPSLVAAPIIALQYAGALETVSFESLEEPVDSLLIEGVGKLRSLKAPRLRKVASFSLSAPGARTEELLLGALEDVEALSLRDGPTSLSAFASLTRLSSLYVRTRNIPQKDLNAFVDALRARGVDLPDVDVRYTPPHP